jgi:hypothetical protein
MNHLVGDAVGIDAVIKKIQKELYSELGLIWVNASINGYGRIYKNMRNYKKIPEVFLKKGNDYEDSFYDDGTDANFFFIENDSHSSQDEMVFTNSMKIVVSLNLKKCYTGADRLDAVAHRDLINVLRNIPTSGKYKISGYETGLERVFSGFSTESIKNDDIHPTHVFAILIDLNYSLTDKCN